MSDVEIEQIRRVNPFPDELPAPPIELVLERLERETAAASVTRRRVRMPSIGGIFAAASVLVSVGIAVVALGDLGHHAHHASAVKPAAGSYPAVVQRVVADYAIFRRPQTAADRALRHGDLPEHALPALVRHLTTKDGHSVFVALSLYRSHLTGWLITTERRGVGQGSFTPFPLRNAQPPSEEIGRRSVEFVPDSVTRVVWNSYSGDVVTTRPHHNVVYGPIPAFSYGATFYAGSRQLAQVLVTVGLVRLAAPSGTSTATGQAAISKTNGTTSMQISAFHVPAGPRHYDVWLYSNPGHQHFLGSRVGPALWPHNTLYGNAAPPDNYRSYRQLLITLQTSSKPTAPGKIVLAGNIPH
jgi:hypothetical protein